MNNWRGVLLDEIVYLLGKHWRWFRAKYHLRTGGWWWGVQRFYDDFACEREATERQCAKEFKELARKWRDPSTWSKSK